jgi:hypothetical protein
MRARTILGALVAVFTLAGCVTAPQAPVALSTSVLQTRMAIVTTATPEVNTFFPGANCLLCIATASAANGTLTKHVRTLSNEDVGRYDESIAQRLRDRGLAVTVVEEALDLRKLPKQTAKGPNLAPRDFRALAQQYNIDRLIVIDVTQIGVERPYAAYVPTAEPKAVVRGVGYVVNLTDNTLEWYAPLNVVKSTDGTWDEPPQFPALTNAYFQAIELARDALTQPFSTP